MKKIEYKWIVYVICFVTIFVCLGFCSSNKSIYLSVITEAFNIKRSLYSINDSCRFVASTIINLFFGTLISRFCAKKLMAAGYISLILSMLIYANATDIWGFYVGGCFLGIGLPLTTTTMVSYIINSWCHEHKGAIMGFVLAADGVGSAVATQIVTPVIYQEGNAFGFQQAYKLTALILLVTGVLVVVFYRNAPSHVNVHAPRNEKQKEVWPGLTFQQAIRKPYFYVIAVCILLTGSVLRGVHGIYAAHLTDVGIGVEYMAMVVGVQALVLTASKFLTGLFNDCFGLRITMFCCDVAAVIAFVALAIASPTVGGKASTMIFGVTFSFALPLETIILPLITEHIFGQKSYTQILGILLAVNTAGFALGTPIINVVYDLCGTYKPILIIFALLMAVITVVFQRIFIVVNKEI